MLVLNDPPVGLYLTFKFRAVFERLRQMSAAVNTLMSMQAQYGQPASADDVMESGDCCAICQEQYCQPIKVGWCRLKPLVNALDSNAYFFFVST